MALQILIVGHVLLGLTATITGAAAMLARKRPGRHPRRGLLYLAGLAGTAVTGTAIALSDWVHLWHLAALGATAATFAAVGFTARRIRWNGWLAWHIVGMSGSYIAVLTAFYVDNGPRLPLWKLLPPITFWYLPAACRCSRWLYVVTSRSNAQGRAARLGMASGTRWCRR